MLLIIALGLAVYSNTLHAPFQSDELNYIIHKPYIKDLSFPIESLRDQPEFYKTLKQRYIGYLTFALNYRLHGYAVEGYHIVNISIHLLSGLLVYLLVFLSFRTPFLRRFTSPEKASITALFSGLFFVVHPLQTEAVTYVYQRLASLMAFFYLGSLVAYILARLTDRLYSRLVFHALAVGLAVLAMKTKENAFTLPIVVVMYELFFFEGKISRRILWIVPLLLTLMIIPISTLSISHQTSLRVDQMTAVTEGVSMWDYLIVEFRVIATYIRLIFLPINQNLDHDYPSFESFLSADVLPAFLLLSAILSTALHLFHRSRTGKRGLRLIAFGIFWFFVTLSVESSLIPLPNPINEYRVYLPSAGFFISVCSAAFLFPAGRRAGRIIIAAGASVVILLSVATYTRNDLWGNNVLFWKDVVGKSPLRARAHNNLGLHYQEAREYEKAIREYKTALSMDPYFFDARKNLGLVYLDLGQPYAAIIEIETALIQNPTDMRAPATLKMLELLKRRNPPADK